MIISSQNSCRRENSAEEEPAEPSLEEIRQVIREYGSWSQDIAQSIAALRREYHELEENIYSYKVMKRKRDSGEGRSPGYEERIAGAALPTEEELILCRQELEEAIRKLEGQRRRIRRIYLAYLLLPREEQRILRAVYLEQKSWKSLPQEFGLTKRNALNLRDRAVSHIREKVAEEARRTAPVAGSITSAIKWSSLICMPF